MALGIELMELKPSDFSFEEKEEFSLAYFLLLFLLLFQNLSIFSTSNVSVQPSIGLRSVQCSDLTFTYLTYNVFTMLSSGIICQHTNYCLNTNYNTISKFLPSQPYP